MTSKKDLLEVAEGFPEMIEKINAENDYLNGEEGLKKFVKDFDQVLIASPNKFSKGDSK